MIHTNIILNYNNFNINYVKYYNVMYIFKLYKKLIITSMTRLLIKRFVNFKYI